MVAAYSLRTSHARRSFTDNPLIIPVTTITHNGVARACNEERGIWGLGRRLVGVSAALCPQGGYPSR